MWDQPEAVIVKSVIALQRTCKAANCILNVVQRSWLCDCCGVPHCSYKPLKQECCSISWSHLCKFKANLTALLRGAPWSIIYELVLWLADNYSAWKLCTWYKKPTWSLYSSKRYWLQVGQLITIPSLTPVYTRSDLQAWFYLTDASKKPAFFTFWLVKSAQILQGKRYNIYRLSCFRFKPILTDKTHKKGNSPHQCKHINTDKHLHNQKLNAIQRN